MAASHVYDRIEEGPPNVRTMNDRRQIIMMLMASGWRNVDIAREFNLSVNYVSIMRTSPLFRAGIEELQHQWREGTVLDVMELIERESVASVSMLVEIRDDPNMQTSVPGRNVQRQASNDLLALNPRVAPRRADSVEHVHRIVLSTKDVREMQQSLGIGDGTRMIETASVADEFADPGIDP